MDFLKLLNEAIPLNVAKKEYTRDKSGAYGENLDKIFGGKDRLIIPVDFKIDPEAEARLNPLIGKIREFLYHQEYTLGDNEFENYVKGIAYKTIDSDSGYDAKNPVKIGKILQKFEPDGEVEVTDRETRGKKKITGKPLLHSFKNDPTRQSGNDNVVVISRHPYDVAGMSTDRNWTSCMNIGTKEINYTGKTNHKGAWAQCVEADIRLGSVVAYLVKKSEQRKTGKIDLKRPTSRILFRPFQNENGAVAYGVGPIKGVDETKFKEFCKEWVLENLNKDIDTKTPYRLSNGLYTGDDDTPVGFAVLSGSAVFRGVAMEKLVTYNDSNLAHIEISDLAVGEESSSYELTMHFKLPKDLEIVESDQHFNDSGIKDKSIIIQKLINIVLRGSGISGGMNQKTRSAMWSMGYNLDHKSFSFTCHFIIRGFGQTYYDDEYYDIDSEKDFFEDELDYLEDIDWKETQHLLWEGVKNGISLEDEKAEDLRKFQNVLKTTIFSILKRKYTISTIKTNNVEMWKRIIGQDGFYYNYYKMVKSGDPEKVRNYRASIYPFKRSFDDVCAVVRGIDEIYDTMKTIKTLYIINPEDMVKDAVSKTVQDMHRHTPEYLRNLTTVPRINNMMRDAKKFKENGEPIPTDFFDFLEDEGLKPK